MMNKKRFASASAGMAAWRGSRGARRPAVSESAGGAAASRRVGMGRGVNLGL